MIRIGFKNVNGIKGKISASHEIFGAIVDKDIDIMGIEEININWTEIVRQEAQMAVRMRCGQGQIVASSTKAKRRDTYQVVWH